MNYCLLDEKRTNIAPNANGLLTTFCPKLKMGACDHRNSVILWPIQDLDSYNLNKLDLSALV